MDESTTRERFELERFAWASPDQLEVSGRFAGLAEPACEPPVLVVQGVDQVHRLPAVPDRSSGAPEEGVPWHVVFAWPEPPEPFTAAELDLGPVAVTLPAPGASTAGSLPVRHHAPGGPEVTTADRLRELRHEADRARAELEAAQEATIAGLLAELAEAVTERDALRTRVLELEADAQRAEAALASVAGARERAGEMTAAAEQMLARLQTLRDELGGAG
jgi:hypothetical protein